MGHCWCLGRPFLKAQWKNWRKTHRHGGSFIPPRTSVFVVGGWGGVGWANNVHSTTFWTWRSTFLALFLGLGGWGGITRVILLRSGHDAPDFSKNVQYYVKVATSLAKNIPGCLCKENMTGTCLGIAKSSRNVQFSGVLNQTIERVQDDWSIQ